MNLIKIQSSKAIGFVFIIYHRDEMDCVCIAQIHVLFRKMKYILYEAFLIGHSIQIQTVQFAYLFE